MTKKIGNIIVAFVVISIVIIQFIQPKKNVQEISENHLFMQASIDDPVKTILKNACMDCHSNNTNYEWYHKISPVSWYVDEHIQEGKKGVDFSDWGRYTKVEKIGLLGEIIEEVEEGKMPLKSYTLMHKNAKLKTSDKERFENWVKTYAEELLMEK